MANDDLRGPFAADTVSIPAGMSTQEYSDALRAAWAPYFIAVAYRRASWIDAILAAADKYDPLTGRPVNVNADGPRG